jgi:NTP pyrophosphatase (non-canonical NTP hydrolase)
MHEHEHEHDSAPARQPTTMSAYQNAALDTVIYPVGIASTSTVAMDVGILYTAFGLASEAGEYAGKIKKAIRDHGGIVPSDRAILEELASELGDLLWYVASAAHEIGYSLEEIANQNMAKLQDRADRGALSGSGDQR